MTPLPILYSFRRCPYAMRARLAIQAAGLPVELREIVLRDKAPEFVAVSPSATVPCLVLADGTVIDESLDIMLWALRRNDPHGWLHPEAGGADAMAALIEMIDGPFKRHLDRYKYETRFEGVDRLAERTAAAAILNGFEPRLEAEGWLCGARASLADMAILPFVRQFANSDRAWFDGEDWPALRRWLTAFETSDAFAGIMSKYARWQAGDTPVVFAA
ncbi:MAG: glutathione S-transferase [Roseibium sp.]|nr:glutathione S-transferase [Roseibium sp.]